MNKIKIGYFADGPWSHRAFERIISNPDIEVKFIVPRSDTRDETLKNFAIKNDIDYLKDSSINTVKFREKVSSYKCDLFVSMSFNQIFKKKLIDIPKHGIINCHAGMLPFYRGRNVLNWVLINDEKVFGITVHYIDEGIDTGDIINQISYQISDEDSYGTLLEKAFDGCADLLYTSLVEIKNGIFKRVPQSQIHPVGFYCGGRGPGDENINWNQSTRKVFNFIRAISIPGPKATTFLNGQEIKINNSRIIENSPNYIGIPGQILSKTEFGYLVKTKDSIIEISDITTDTKIRVGDRLK